MSVSRPFSEEALEVTKVLLENGARANDRIEIPNSDEGLPVGGPTLLHALIGRLTPTNEEEAVYIIKSVYSYFRQNAGFDVRDSVPITCYDRASGNGFNENKINIGK